MLELRIEDLTHDGRGVARANKKAIFVNGALPGELVQARIVKRHRQYDEAVVTAVLEASAERIVPACVHVGVCSGCTLQHLTPAAQIALKQKQLLDALERIGKVQPRELLEPLQRDVWGYRRKGRLSVRYVEKKGAALVGFREANGKYVAQIASCLVLDPRVGLRITELSDLVSALAARAQIAQIEIAAAERVALVFRHLVPLVAADRELLHAFGELHGFDIVLQSAGPETLVTLTGEAPADLHYEVEDGLSLRYRPLDFVQVNDSINRAMVAQAIELLGVGADDRVLDLYCGLGNFTLPLARRSEQVVGVEGDAGLIARARANALRNGISNVEFLVADLARSQALTDWARAPYTRLLLDPARAGAEAVFEYLPTPTVERVVYVSCHPGTLARDAALLVNRGFDLISAGVMDMFPHTAHVESMALFVRR